MRALLAFCLVFLPSLASADAPTARLEAVLEKWERSHHVSGSLAVLGPDLRVELATGLADDITGRKNGASTIYGAASCGKQLTASAILRLEEQGRLRVSDPVRLHLRDYPAAHLRRGGREVTIEHLLRHSAGLVDVYETPEIDEKENKRNILFHEYYAALRRRPLTFTPGTKFEYSNSAYLLLGEIVRRHSRRSYTHFVTDTFLRPHGLHASSVGRPESPHLARQYDLVDGRRVDYLAHHGITVPDWHLGEANTDGNFFSTAPDLALWARKLGKGLVLSSESTRKMFTPGPFEGYGYGWFEEAVSGVRGWSHDGSWFGYRCYMYYFPARDTSVVWLSNQVMDEGLEEMAQELAGAALAR